MKGSRAFKKLQVFALLSLVAKIKERLLLPEFGLKTPSAEDQHSFRKSRSTITALHCIFTVKKGMNKARPPGRSLLVAFDLTAALNTVNYTVLLNDMLESSLSNNERRCVSGYLQGRFIFIEVYNDLISRRRNVKQGVAQGGVLSPSFFNIYISKLTESVDVTIIKSGSNVQDLAQPINKYLTELIKFLLKRSLSLSVDESSAIVFATGRQN